jgi:hypothetical protein
MKTPGNIVLDRYGGTLTLTSPRGTLTLQFQQPARQPAASASNLVYTVIGGSGVYARTHGSGHMSAELSPDYEETPAGQTPLGTGQIAIQFGA